jgi:hypothetical protein
MPAKETNMRKATKIVAAEQGRVRGIGGTKAAAAADLKRQVKGWCEAPDPHMETRLGYAIIVYSDPNGYSCYRVIGPDDLDKDRVLHASCTSSSAMPRAISEARYAVAQRAWNSSMAPRDDEPFLARTGCDKDHADQLRSWIKWQRSYASLIATGYTAAQAHEMASAFA